MTSYFSDKLWTAAGRRVNRTARGVGNYTLLDSDHFVCKTAITGGGDTLTLPVAATVAAGTVFVITDESGSAGTNPITVDGNASETIDGALTLDIDVDYGFIAIYTDGANWFTVATRLLVDLPESTNNILTNQIFS